MHSINYGVALMLKTTNTAHGPMVIFEDDLFVSRCLDLYGEWSPGELDVYTHFIKPGMTVIEVGSHIGTFTVPISKLCRHVYSFEPQRTVFQVLNTNLIHNNCHNVFTYMAGVGSTSDTILMKEIDYAHTLTKKGFNSGGVQVDQIKTETNGYPCPMVRLDDFIPHEIPIGFMKVDAEGMDLQVLKGASLIIRKHKPVLYIESNLGDTAAIRTIQHMGYRVFEHRPLGWRPNNFKNNKHQVLKPSKEGIYDYMLLCLDANRPISTNLKEL